MDDRLRCQNVDKSYKSLVALTHALSNHKISWISDPQDFISSGNFLAFG